MSDDRVGDAVAGLAPMAGAVAGDTPLALWVVPDRVDGCLAEGPVEGRAALLGVPATTADRAGWGDSWDPSALRGNRAGSRKAPARAELREKGQGQALP